MTRSRLPLSLRAVSLALLVVGYVAYVRGNDAEANAIFDAGGDAGMWGIGIIVVTILLIPGAALLLLSLAISVKAKASAVLAVAAGAVLLASSAWLAKVLLPPDRATSEGSPLDLAQWTSVSHHYVAACGLVAGAGVFLIVSGAARTRDRRGAQAESQFSRVPTARSGSATDHRPAPSAGSRRRWLRSRGRRRCRDERG